MRKILNEIPMTSSPITMKEWATYHRNSDSAASNKHYLTVVNDAYPFVFKLIGEDGYAGEACCRRITCSLVAYFADNLSNRGDWERFVTSHYALYNRWLPFYELNENYNPRELHVEDLAFLIWHNLQQEAIESRKYAMVHPDSFLIILTAQSILTLFEAEQSNRALEIHSSGVVDVAIAPPAWLPQFENLKECLPSQSDASCPSYPIQELHTHFLTANEGSPIFFCRSTSDLVNRFGVALFDAIESQLNGEEEGVSNYVVLSDPEVGVVVATHIAAYIGHRDNPFYDPAKAAQHALTLLCDSQLISPRLIHYLLRCHLLPDAQLRDRIDPLRGKRIVQENLPFLYRYFQSSERQQTQVLQSLLSTTLLNVLHTV